MKLNEIHSFTTLIKYSDLDMYSVVYHPNYFVLLDEARNEAFKYFGYPIELQLKEKVGFTVAGIKNVEFKRPLFMGERVKIYTEAISYSKRSCEVKHWIDISDEDSTITIFSAVYVLVFVSIDDVVGFPLDAKNMVGLKSIAFTDKVKKLFGIT